MPRRGEYRCAEGIACFDGFVRVIIIVMFGTKRWNVDFLDKFYA